jgi:Transposase domain (DUF772)
LAAAVLSELSPLFDQMYSVVGWPSIPPERLLKASLLMALYTVRSERMFCEQLDYNLLFRWFLNLELDEPSFDQNFDGAQRRPTVPEGEPYHSFVECFGHARPHPHRGSKK